MKYIILLAAMLFSLSAGAQCPEENKAFKSGEYLQYNLYFNWKFVWIKCGTASMNTTLKSYNGQQAYKTTLITRGSKRADNYFVLRDTLLSYSTQNMVPLYYRKAAREGKRYYIDEVWYSYPKGNTHVRQHRINHKGEHKWKEAEYQDCLHDMMSVFLYARSFDASGWKDGQRIKIPLVDGKDVTPAVLIFKGRKTIKGDNGVKYKCLTLSYQEKDEDDGKLKEIVRFFVTDDENHVPVRLDMYLKFGTAKAFVTGMKGVKNKITCIEK